MGLKLINAVFRCLFTLNGLVGLFSPINWRVKQDLDETQTRRLSCEMQKAAKFTHGHLF